MTQQLLLRYEKIQTFNSYEHARCNDPAKREYVGRMFEESKGEGKLNLVKTSLDGVEKACIAKSLELSVQMKF